MRNTTAIVLLTVTAVLFVSGCASVKKDWDQAQTSGTAGTFKEFLQKHPDSQYAAEAKERIEKLDWERTQASTNIGEFREFLQNYPNSQYARQAQSKISAFSKEAWEKAQKEDKIRSYEGFMRAYPDSEFSKKAKERRDWQRANPAVVTIVYPKTVTTVKWINGRWVKMGRGGWGKYRWDTVFNETGGKAGFELRATNFYIRDPSGGKWSGGWSDSVKVKAGGRGTVDYWCDSSSKWTGGYYYTRWVGEDDWGNRISILQRVHLGEY